MAHGESRKPGTLGGDANEFLQRAGLATIGRGQGLTRMLSTQRTDVYVTRTHGGVGGRGRKVPLYPNYVADDSARHGRGFQGGMQA